MGWEELSIKFNKPTRRHAFHVHVVGTGPAGMGYLLGYLSSGRSGRVIVSDMRDPYRDDIVCSGLLTHHGYSYLADVLPVSRSLRAVYDRVYLVNGWDNLGDRDNWREIRLQYPMYRVDRFELSRVMYDKVFGGMPEEGWYYLDDVELYYEKRVISSLRDIKSHVVIGADGPTSTVARLFGFPAVREMYHTYHLDGRVDGLKDGLLVIFDRRIPGFFSWVIPGRFGQVGLGVPLGINPRDRLRLLLHQLEGVGIRIHSKRERSSLLPLSLRPIRRFSKDGYHVHLIGDAAGHVKSLTGGGVFYGFALGYELARRNMYRFLRWETELRMLNLLKPFYPYPLVDCVLALPDDMIGRFETDSITITLKRVLGVSPIKSRFKLR